jgi:16S rRNA (uracil1498-N3)-methyltransferase
MKHLFCCFAEPADNKLWQIATDDVHHLHAVLRHKVGDEVLFMDGAGTMGQGILVTLDRQKGLLQPTSVTKEAPPKVPVTLILGALKPKVLDDLLPTLNEIGVDHILTYRQTHTPKSAFEPKILQRWEKILHASSKQCKRAYLPTVTTLNSVLEIEAKLPIGSKSNRFILQENASVTIVDAKLNTAPVAIAVGSESGMSQEETDLFATWGFQPVSLGPYILRAVTAAMTASAAVCLKRSNLR